MQTQAEQQRAELRERAEEVADANRRGDDLQSEVAAGDQRYQLLLSDRSVCVRLLHICYSSIVTAFHSLFLLPWSFRFLTV